MAVSDGPELIEGRRAVHFLKREAGRHVVVGRSEGAVDTESPEAAEAIESAFRHAERRIGRRLWSERGVAAAIGGRAPSARGGRVASNAQVGCYNTDGAKWSGPSAGYRIGDSIPAAWAASIDAAASAWSSSGVSFRLLDDPASTNEVSYKDLAATYGSSYNNTLAVATTWYSRTTNRISRATLEFNSKWTWGTAGAQGEMDVQSIATHEFGHWLRLLDIYTPSSCADVTMWGSAASGETKKRTLEQADIDGFTSLYGGGPSSVTAPALTSPANGATGVGASPTLTWTAVTNATSYEVYFGATPGPGLATTVSGASFQPGALTAGAVYYWRVVARNATSSASSATYSFTVAAEAGGTTPGITLLSPANGATGIGYSTAMQWAAVQGATGYDLYVGTTTTPGRIGTVRGTSVTVSGFWPSTVFYWKVVARTPSGSVTSPVWSFGTR
jgi:hypothetical protein